MPNLFVPGFAKSGTSHLCSVLGESPDIFLPREKEPHYFSVDLVPEDYRTDLTTYQSYYAQSTSRYRLDGSVSYMYSEVAIERILQACEAPRFIVLVRHPFDRMISHYRFNKRNGVEQRSFPEALRNREELTQQWTYDYRAMSDYSPQITRLLSLVERAQVRLVDYAEYRRDPASTVKRIGTFLGVDIPLNETLHKTVNVSKQPIFPFINSLIRVDSGWKRAAKSMIPFQMRRSIKKFIHNRNISEKDIPFSQDSYTDAMKAALDQAHAAFRSEYRDIYI